MATAPKKRRDDLVLNAIFNPHEPLVSHEETENHMNSIDDTTTIISDEMKQLEIDAVNAAQKGELIDSLSFFNQLIQTCPEYASGYNNRAQLFRLQGDNSSAYDDLHKAIELSNGRGKAASQAYTQRGLLYQLDGETEKALDDFKCASELGNHFAKQQLVAMNPYAALCNQMLCEVFSRIYEGKPDL